ncbi:MAG TPA: universal stress protein [Tepidisphaeraceae bacterium]|nr:universal stress protein [Tepidisphaeraceae bacterium]
MLKRILIPIDNGKPAARAVEAAVELAMQVRARLAILHVIDVTAAYMPELGTPNQNILGQLRRDGERLMASTMSRLPASLKCEQIVVEGEPAGAIISAAREWNADLIVIGNDSRGRSGHFLLGTTADAVIRRAPCPVMALRADARIGEPQSSAAAI